jgi:hypothetical protein
LLLYLQAIKQAPEIVNAQAVPRRPEYNSEVDDNGYVINLFGTNQQHRQGGQNIEDGLQMEYHPHVEAGLVMEEGHNMESGLLMEDEGQLGDGLLMDDGYIVAEGIIMDSDDQMKAGPLSGLHAEGTSRILEDDHTEDEVVHLDADVDVDKSNQVVNYYPVKDGRNLETNTYMESDPYLTPSDSRPPSLFQSNPVDVKSSPVAWQNQEAIKQVIQDYQDTGSNLSEELINMIASNENELYLTKDQQKPLLRDEAHNWEQIPNDIGNSHSGKSQLHDQVTPIHVPRDYFPASLSETNDRREFQLTKAIWQPLTSGASREEIRPLIGTWVQSPSEYEKPQEVSAEVWNKVEDTSSSQELRNRSKWSSQSGKLELPTPPARTVIRATKTPWAPPTSNITSTPSRITTTLAATLTSPTPLLQPTMGTTALKLKPSISSAERSKYIFLSYNSSMSLLKH